MGKLFIKNLQQRRSFSALVANVSGMGRGTIAEGQCRIWKRPGSGKNNPQPMPMGIMVAPKYPSNPPSYLPPTKGNPVTPTTGFPPGVVGLVAAPAGGTPTSIGTIITANVAKSAAQQ